MISAVCGRAPPAIQLLPPQPFLFPPADDPPRVSHDWLSVTNTRVLPSLTGDEVSAGAGTGLGTGCGVPNATGAVTKLFTVAMLASCFGAAAATGTADAAGVAWGIGRHACVPNIVSP